jgi:hypothetical protein
MSNANILQNARSVVPPTPQQVRDGLEVTALAIRGGQLLRNFPRCSR